MVCPVNQSFLGTDQERQVVVYVVKWVYTTVGVGVAYVVVVVYQSLSLCLRVDIIIVRTNTI